MKFPELPSFSTFDISEEEKRHLSKQKYEYYKNQLNDAPIIKLFYLKLCILLKEFYYNSKIKTINYWRSQKSRIIYKIELIYIPRYLTYKRIKYKLKNLSLEILLLFDTWYIFYQKERINTFLLEVIKNIRLR